MARTFSTLDDSEFTFHNSLFPFLFSLFHYSPSALLSAAVARFRFTHSAAEFYLRFSNGKSRTRGIMAHTAFGGTVTVPDN